MIRAVDVVKRVAPHCRPAYLQALEHGDQALQKAGLTTPLRMAHFLAQILEETGGLTICEESGDYSAERIRVVWPSRPEAVAFAHNPSALFNHVYASRMGNGGPNSGDGWAFRGRGPLQTTGREAYTKYGVRCRADFVTNPDLLCSNQYALAPALAEWQDSGCSALADADNIREITLRINGGYTNLSDRERWLSVVKPLIDKVDFLPTSSEPSASTGAIVVGGGTIATAAHHGWLNWSLDPMYVQYLIDFGLAAVALYFALDVAMRAYNSTGTLWQRILSVGEQSATIAWQKFVILVTGLTGGVAWVADLMGDPSIGTAIQNAVTPKYAAIAALGVAIISVWARKRTLTVASPNA